MQGYSFPEAVESDEAMLKRSILPHLICVGLLFIGSCAHHDQTGIQNDPKRQLQGRLGHG